MEITKEGKSGCADFLKDSDYCTTILRAEKADLEEVEQWIFADDGMAGRDKIIPFDASLARRHLPLASGIAHRLARRYGWIPREDLEGYAYLGLALAARVYDPARGLSFPRFACIKGMFLAIDEMRKDGLLRRADSRAPGTTCNAMEFDVPDPGAGRAMERFEARDLCARLLRRLKPRERQLITMIYADHMTYREAASIQDVTESAICLKHKALLQKLRHRAAARKLVA